MPNPSLSIKKLSNNVGFGARRQQLSNDPIKGLQASVSIDTSLGVLEVQTNWDTMDLSKIQEGAAKGEAVAHSDRQTYDRGI